MNSPDNILLIYANKFIANSSFSQAKFIHDLLLPALIEAGLEKPEDHKTADEYESWRSAKVRQINGILNGHTNMPLRWVWCWLDVLPAPYGPEARKEFLSQANLVGISLAGVINGKSNIANLPQIFREVADVMDAGALVAADGVYNDKDDPEQLKKLSNELADVIEHCMRELFALNAATDISATRGGKIVKMCE
ncbi:hypothetical protein G3489_23355 [Shewanella baltica]|nr:hypothetical protein [Shewanella baltica]MCS6272601.1 hypothetical protein [Shewanella baltica]